MCVCVCVRERERDRERERERENVRVFFLFCGVFAIILMPLVCILLSSFFRMAGSFTYTPNSVSSLLLPCFPLLSQDIHKELEEKISEFHGTEKTILYASCFDANAGIFETLLGKEDAVIRFETYATQPIAAQRERDRERERERERETERETERERERESQADVWRVSIQANLTRLSSPFYDDKIACS